MKAKRVLILSLIGNLALAATLIILWRGSPAMLETQASTPEVSSTALEPSRTAIQTPAASKLTLSWRTIESDDYRQYVANLRAVGCPEWVVRDVIAAAVDGLYLQKSKTNFVASPPWAGASRRRSDAIAQSAIFSASRAEKQALLQELLGYEWNIRADDLWNQNYTASLMLGFLSDEKEIQVAALVEKYKGMAGNIRAANVVLIDEDMARLQELYHGLVAETSRMVNSWELGELEARVQAFYILPGDDIHFDGVAINGTELREIARASKILKNEVRNQFLGDENLSEQEQARREADFLRQVEKLLSPGQFADFQRAQDEHFREIYHFTQDHNVSKDTADKIYETRRAAEDEAGRVAADNQLSAEDKAAALDALKTTTANAISSTLGDAAADYLEGPGQWLENLAAPRQDRTP
ncbi:MAG: hypothetical protein WBN75_12120 [Verrucomicrobiia bacterium]